uniref:Nuclear factor kappa B subunit 1 n=1 Tax=Salmo trutta TaxID=8032 RepID=A0A674DBU5_SALTR
SDPCGTLFSSILSFMFSFGQFISQILFTIWTGIFTFFRCVCVCENHYQSGSRGCSSNIWSKKCLSSSLQICNYQGLARVVVQLVTNSKDAHLHAHSLVGKQCDKGICIADLQPKDSSISFPNLGILHVTKKNVSKTLEDRMSEAYRMGYNCGIVIHPEMDAFQGEFRIPRELTDHQRNLISSAASYQAKEMDLSVVRLMFTAFLPDSDGGFSRRLDPVISDPIFDSKAPNASNLKIVRMDRTAGCVTGGEEVYLLCDKVQKDDIQVRFYEDDETGLTWEAFGDFSPTDVHRQFAIVFKTPKYRDLNLQKPTSVFVQLKRKSDNETSEPKPFTYHPQIIDKEEVQRKRQKTLPNFQDYSGHGGAGGLYRGPGGGGPATGGGGGTTNMFLIISASGSRPLQGVCVCDSVLEARVLCIQSMTVFLCLCTECVLEARLVDVAERQAEALFQYAVTGDVSYLLAPQRQLMTAQDENGDTGLHLGVIHSQTDAVRSLAQVLSALPGEEVLNMRNNLYQTPLHLAVITQQKAAAEAILLAGADVTLSDRHGNTALHLAAQQKEGGMVGFLLRHREIVELVDLPNAAGLCSLHLAVLANSLSSLRDLLVSGGSVEVQERSCGRTALHLATEQDNISLAGCLLLEGNANVDCCTYNGSSPLHTATGRGSVKLTALLMAAGGTTLLQTVPFVQMSQFDDCLDEEDEGYIPGTTPLNMAATPEVGSMFVINLNVVINLLWSHITQLTNIATRALCQALECPEGGWESLAHILGLGILNSAFRLSSSPASTLLDSYEVSGGKVKDLLEGLRTVGNCSALTVLEGALCEAEQAPQSTTKLLGKLKNNRRYTLLCDSGVELSTA